MKIRLVSCGIAAAVMAGALSFLALSAPAAQYAAKDKDLAMTAAAMPQLTRQIFMLSFLLAPFASRLPAVS